MGSGLLLAQDGGGSAAGLNPVSMLLKIIYDTASGITGIVGLTPLQFLAGLGGLLLVYLLVAFVRNNFGDPGWSVDEEPKREEPADAAIPGNAQRPTLPADAPRA